MRFLQRPKKQSFGYKLIRKAETDVYGDDDKYSNLHNMLGIGGMRGKESGNLEWDGIINFYSAWRRKT